MQHKPCQMCENDPKACLLNDSTFNIPEQEQLQHLQPLGILSSPVMQGLDLCMLSFPVLALGMDRYQGHCQANCGQTRDDR